VLDPPRSACGPPRPPKNPDEPCEAPWPELVPWLPAPCGVPAPWPAPLWTLLNDGPLPNEEPFPKETDDTVGENPPATGPCCTCCW
jgi:hypothetical protein